MSQAAAQISIIQAELVALSPNSSSLSLGTTAGSAMLAVSAYDAATPQACRL
jgi:hypothetical protein